MQFKPYHNWMSRRKVRDYLEPGSTNVRAYCHHRPWAFWQTVV